MNQLKLTPPCPSLVFRLVFTFCIAMLLTNGSISSAQIPVFQREIDTIPVVIDGLPVTSPFVRGLSYSKPTFADIDKDGKLDLFVGDSQSNLRFYRNTGTAANPVFTLVTVNFVSVHDVFYSAPSFADIDNDGDLDLFVGNSDGTIYFYRNTGAAFTLETTNFASIDVGNYSVPSFADIDNDRDLDLFVGEEAGNINFYRNNGAPDNPMFTLETENLAPIFDAESCSAPTFADIDNDGDLDLFVGEADGNINFYRNNGSTPTNPVFILETKNFASIIVNYSIPSFADIDKDGDLDLFVGKVDGSIFYYSNTGNATNPAFTLVTKNFDSIDFGDDSAPSFADIDNDGDFDLFVGEESEGNINFYRNTGNPTSPAFTLETTNLGSIDVGNNSVPSFADIDKDGILDLFVGRKNGNIFYYRNTGTATNPAFTLVTDNFASIDVGDYSAPSFVDIDNDGNLDLIVGEFDGNLNFYRNTGTPTSPVFTLVTDSLASIDVGDVGAYSVPSFADIDKDGDVDLFVGFSFGYISYYRNDGTITSPVFNLKKLFLPSVDELINIGGNSAPTFVDIDNDGDLDLFLGEYEGGLHFYRNITSNRIPIVANAIPNQTLTVGGAAFTRNLNASPAVFNDPDGDALTYTASSSVINIATAGILGATLTVSPVAAGSATITVTADDGGDGIRSTTFTVTVNLPAYPSSLNLTTTVAYPSRPSASDYPATDYRIVGLPGVSNRLVNNFLSGTQDQDWQVFRDNGAASNFFVAFDGSASFQFSVGRAFWIISKSAFNANLIASSAPLNAMQEIEIPLQSGWNLIANPFTTSVSWSKIQTANNVTEPIWAFNGSFSQADTFKTYAGYYFFNATNLSLLKIPYSAYFSGGSAADVVSTNWQVHISLTAGKFNEQAVSFGVANEASQGLDIFDFRKPRALAATPTVEFKRPTWDAGYSTFASDIRPEFEDAESWEFDIRAISREASQLTFSGISKIPSRFEVYLIDAGRAQSVNLRDDSLYHFTPAAELMKFKVVVGRKENVQEQLNSLTLPKEFALGPNYPNPFNPITTIPVAIPLAAEIKLKVYNLLGAEVKTLYDGSIEAGRYWFNWDGRNELGNQAATGVYLYWLNTSKGVTLIGKMILVR